MIDWYEIKDWFRRKVIDLGIWLVQKAEPCKNEGLSYRLHNLADGYARRPTNQWNYRDTQ
jgi:hypothetical protein